MDWNITIPISEGSIAMIPVTPQFMRAVGSGVIL